MLNWGSLGKKRSKLGKWIDARGLKQKELAEQSGIGMTALTKYCRDDLNLRDVPRRVYVKIVKALRTLTNENVDEHDFWT